MDPYVRAYNTITTDRLVFSTRKAGSQIEKASSRIPIKTTCLVTLTTDVEVKVSFYLQLLILILVFLEIALSLYVEEVCTKVIDVDLKSLGLEEIKPPSLRPDDAENNNDEVSVEVKKDAEPPSENELQSVKVVEETTETPVVTSEEPASPTISPEETSQHPKNTKKSKQSKKKHIPNVAEIEEVSEENSNENESTTTTEEPTTTTTGYKPVGECRYSALYQTVFNGSRLIKRVPVTSATQCFAACHAERCRSANLIQIEGIMKSCELYKDSIIDFRRTDVLTFDAGAVHFDSIQCNDA